MEENGNKVYYDHWGIGRITPAKAMGVMLGTLGQSCCCSDFLDRLHPADTADFTEKFKEQMDVLNSIDFDNPAIAGKIMQKCANNNGGVLIRITDEGNGEMEIDYAFMLGREEGGDYKHWCSFDKWCEKFPEYCDESFREVFRKVMEYLGSEEATNKPLTMNP